MVIREVLNIWKNDTDLKRLLKSTVSDPRIYMNAPVYTGDCIVYSFTPLISDGVTAQSRIEVDCYSSDYTKSYEILKTIEKLMVTVGDDPRTENILSIEKNGGGYVFDKNVKYHMFKAIFSIKERVR